MRRWPILLAGAALALAGAPTGAFAFVGVGSTAASPAPAETRDAFRAIFAAIRLRDWPTADALIAAHATAPLAPLARAEMWVGSGAPGIDGQALADLVAAAPELPEAPTLAAMARARGAAVPVALPPAPHRVKAP